MLGNKLDRVYVDEDEETDRLTQNRLKDDHNISHVGIDPLSNSFDDRANLDTNERIQKMEQELLDWCVHHAKEHKIEISFMLVSAKSGQNIDEAF